MTVAPGGVPLRSSTTPTDSAMDPNTRALIMGAAGAGGAEKTYVEDVFSTWLYTGNGSTQTITNGIDLSGKGGLVWIKGRSGATGHRLVDTARGATKSLESNTTAVEATESTGVTSFNSTGFALGADADYSTNAATYASWTFRKAAKFFDVVTYTGNGSNRTIAHNLGSVPGCIIVKRTDSAEDWRVYHRGLSNDNTLFLNLDSAALTSTGTWNYTTPTATEFSIGTNVGVNASGGTYVAYLFAHDAGGFGDSGNESIIKCGSYTGNGSSTGPYVNLGWEPQWLLIKSSDRPGGSEWAIVDNMRGMAATTGTTAQAIYANSSTTESAFNAILPDATGFTPTGSGAYSNANGINYIYIAIRRGPMKTPTDATKVFKADLTAVGTTFSTGFDAVDGVVMKREDSAGAPWHWMPRLTNQEYLDSSSTGAGTSYSAGTIKWDLSGSFYQNAVVSPTQYLFRRAPGFFDVVAYTGTGANRTVSHNLGVAPELMITKCRSTTSNWRMYHKDVGNTKSLRLNETAAASTSSEFWNDTTPTSSVFTLGINVDLNTSSQTYVAYLFASCPGVSKVGSYTGTGTTLSVDCGFTNGTRFVLIKRTDSTGDWYVWDTARGIVSGDDPYLLLNSTAAEVTNTDYIDPLSSGFQISSTAPAAINANGGSYIYLAIA